MAFLIMYKRRVRKAFQCEKDHAGVFRRLSCVGLSLGNSNENVNYNVNCTIGKLIIS